MDKAAAYEYWDVVRWLLNHFQDFRVTQVAVEEVIRANQFELLKEMLGRNRIDSEGERITLGRGINWTCEDMQDCDEEVAHWLFATTPIASVAGQLSSLVSFCQREADITRAEWFIKRGCPYRAADAVCSDPDVTCWMFARGGVGEGDVARALQSMAGAGRLGIVQWILSKYPPSSTRGWQQCGADAFWSACQSNCLPVVKYFLEHGPSQPCLDLYPNAMSEAAVRGHLDLANYLHSQGFTAMDGSIFRRAAVAGCLEVVQWLCCQFGASFSLLDS